MLLEGYVGPDRTRFAVIYRDSKWEDRVATQENLAGAKWFATCPEALKKLDIPFERAENPFGVQYGGKWEETEVYYDNLFRLNRVLVCHASGERELMKI